MTKLNHAEWAALAKLVKAARFAGENPVGRLVASGLITDKDVAEHLSNRAMADERVLNKYFKQRRVA